MKKKIWMLVVIILLVLAGVLGFCYLSLPKYETPFSAAEVQSVKLSNFWEYKIIEDPVKIEKLIGELSQIRIVSDFTPGEEAAAEGSVGYSVSFACTDGRQLEYSAVQRNGLRFIFTDGNGNAYNARNFTLRKLWNQLGGGIPADYYYIYYKGHFCEGPATVVQVPKDAAFAGTVAGITAHPDSELECSYGKTGQNVYVWEENGTKKLGVEIQQEVWPDAQAFAIDIPNFDESSKNWGVALTAETVTPTGLTVACHHTGGEDVYELHTGSYYVLQKREAGNWVDVECLPQEYEVAWTAEAWIIQKENTTSWDVNWQWLYGELPAGEYRIGKEITNFRGTGDYDSQMLYAEFVIN